MNALTLTHQIDVAGRDIRSIVVEVGLIEHCAVSLVWLGSCFLVEVAAETRDAGTGEDTEQLALMFVELGGRFTAEGEQLLAKEGSDTSEREMCQARAVVEQGCDSIKSEIDAVAQVHAFQRARSNRTQGTRLLRLCESIDAPVCDVAAFHKSNSLQLWKNS